MKTGQLYQQHVLLCSNTLLGLHLILFLNRHQCRHKYICSKDVIDARARYLLGVGVRTDESLEKSTLHATLPTEEMRERAPLKWTLDDITSSTHDLPRATYRNRFPLFHLVKACI